jgi:hypothetical protein
LIRSGKQILPRMTHYFETFVAGHMYLYRMLTCLVTFLQCLFCLQSCDPLSEAALLDCTGVPIEVYGCLRKRKNWREKMDLQVWVLCLRCWRTQGPTNLQGNSTTHCFVA